jgi:hypothetical protein
MTHTDHVIYRFLIRPTGGVYPQGRYTEPAEDICIPPLDRLCTLCLQGPALEGRGHFKHRYLENSVLKMPETSESLFLFPICAWKSGKVRVFQVGVLGAFAPEVEMVVSSVWRNGVLGSLVFFRFFGLRIARNPH